MPQHPPVRYPVPNELHEPFMVQRIEEPLNVRVEHPVHFALFYGDAQRIQRLQNLG